MDDALSSAPSTDSAFHGGSLLPVAAKVTKSACPYHPALRFAPGSLAPSSLQGPGPMAIGPFAASMRLNPLRDDSARPSARGVWCCLLVWAPKAKRSSPTFLPTVNQLPGPVTERSAVKGRMSGALLLWFLSSWASKKKGTRRARRNLPVGQRKALRHNDGGAGLHLLVAETHMGLAHKTPIQLNPESKSPAEEPGF
ncbi:hypothetical protein SAMN04244574_01277 [Azotobacter beijerinckii]|uniref:Uncharacterized protein n=1 Tax=Azotobacter beijerinckii TaxID=170623 RepID=A0A1I4B2T4_9GAMM|nr:hypothetical protein SAMN04244571_01164 [Azotobacter beijerinckii]SFK62361.1 hypothetical protein SAMN04244574_01277 [Azotobacter beijerinckii]